MSLEKLKLTIVQREVIESEEVVKYPLTFTMKENADGTTDVIPTGGRPDRETTVLLRYHPKGMIKLMFDPKDKVQVSRFKSFLWRAEKDYRLKYTNGGFIFGWDQFTLYVPRKDGIIPSEGIRALPARPLRLKTGWVRSTRHSIGEGFSLIKLPNKPLKNTADHYDTDFIYKDQWLITHTCERVKWMIKDSRCTRCSKTFTGWDFVDLAIGLKSV